MFTEYSYVDISGNSEYRHHGPIKEFSHNSSGMISFYKPEHANNNDSEYVYVFIKLNGDVTLTLGPKLEK